MTTAEIILCVALVVASGVCYVVLKAARAHVPSMVLVTTASVFVVCYTAALATPLAFRLAGIPVMPDHESLMETLCAACLLLVMPYLYAVGFLALAAGKSLRRTPSREA